MPIIVTMEFPYESDQPGTAGDTNSPEADPIQGADPSISSGQQGITAERLKQIIRNMETGFYDSPQVREQIAHRVREELGP